VEHSVSIFILTMTFSRSCAAPQKFLVSKPKMKRSTRSQKRSRYTPRTANYLLKRARDYAQIKEAPLTKSLALDALNLLGVDEQGLTSSDRKLLSLLTDKFSGGPVGLSTLAASMSEDAATIEEVHEPYLLQIGFLERTPRGRVITERGRKHGGISGQEKLV
jgi:Holliday junction DNA helicase RuvB